MSHIFALRDFYITIEQSKIILERHKSEKQAYFGNIKLQLSIGTIGHRNIWFTPTRYNYWITLFLLSQHNNFMLKFNIEYR